MMEMRKEGLFSPMIEHFYSELTATMAAAKFG